MAIWFFSFNLIVSGVTEANSVLMTVQSDSQGESKQRIFVNLKRRKLLYNELESVKSVHTIWNSGQSVAWIYFCSSK